MNFIATIASLLVSASLVWGVQSGRLYSRLAYEPENFLYANTIFVPMVAKVSQSTSVHAVRVQYNDYQTSRAVVPGMVDRLQKAHVNMVGLDAGRVEWALFKWLSHPEYTSSVVKATSVDFLAEDSAIYGQFAHINAVIDAFAPYYILAHPETASINALGQRNPNLVGTMDLVEGEFGQLLLDMVTYIAANYPKVNSISVTELSYRLDGYGPKDKAAYLAYSGRTDWPRLANGQIIIDDPSIGNWRSHVMDIYLDKLVAAAHAHGKQFFLDVSLSTTQLAWAGNQYGTRYDLMLQHIDKLVVWGYYYLENYPPEYLDAAAQFFTRYGCDRVIMSIGMWGPSTALMPPDLFLRGLQASANGGLKNIWVTPSIYMDDSLWKVLGDFWSSH